MMDSANLTGKIAFDANSLNSLKQAAKENSPEAIKGVAKQFEAIFMNMLLKSMREASPQDNPFDNEQSRTFTAMLDQQLSSNLASKGLGLAEVLAKQLSKSSYATTSIALQASIDSQSNSEANSELNVTLLNSPYSSSGIKPTVQKTMPVDGKALDFKLFNNNISEFQNNMAHHAKEASRDTGIPAHLMLGQAALESGWGKHEIKGVDGTPSKNLFGIKATSNWNGKVVEASTTEYIDGIKQKRIEKFRAYDNYTDSFKDFANLINNNPRYENVMASLQNANNYAQALQKAGYATDPNYAVKLANVIQQISIP